MDAAQSRQYRYFVTERNMYVAELRVELKLQMAALLKVDQERSLLKLMLFHIKQGRVKQYKKLLAKFNALRLETA